MAQFGVLGTTMPSTIFVQSASPKDLQARIARAIADIAALPNSQRIAAIDLAGAGDGHTFVALIDYAPAASFQSGDAPLNPASAMVLTYMASNQQELAAQRAAAVAQSPPLLVRAELLTGASTGTRFLGALICDAAALSHLARGLIGFSGDGTPNTITVAAPSTFLPIPAAPTAFSASALNNLFVQDPPGSGTLRYTGELPLAANVEGLVSCAPAAGSHTLAIGVYVNGVQLPLSVFTATAIFLAGLVDKTFGTLALAQLAPNDLIELRMANLTGAVDIAVFDASLRVVAA